MNTIRQIGRFCRRQWYVLPVGAVGVVLVTLVHEAAHAAAVVLQGGEVTEFVWLPDWNRWGHIGFHFAHSNYSAFAISAAPYCVWLAVSLGTGCLSLLRRRGPFVAASWIFVWLYFVPLGDIAYAAGGWLRGSQNDFYHAFGPADTVGVSIVWAAALAAASLGFLVQHRLYGESALPIRAYAILAGVVLLVFLL